MLHIKRTKILLQYMLFLQYANDSIPEIEELSAKMG